TRFPHRFDEGVALNCYVPMRFAERAVVEIVNESNEPHGQYYYIDYETCDPDKGERGYFHSEFRRINPLRGWDEDHSKRYVYLFPNKERCAWENNYAILDTKGKGHYIGCNLSVTNFEGGWWGEGDDMIWVDGYKWPPEIHGTGSEDYFNQAWGMNETAFLRHGSSIWEGHTSRDSRYTGAKGAYAGKLIGGYQSSYVFHVENPIRFEKEIKVTIEAGHANSQSHEMSSVAYWYMAEPSAVVAPPPIKMRQPVLRDNMGNWLIDETTQLPGHIVKENAEFIKAKAEYDKQVEREGWPRS
ncbi:glycoside hydrolase family 172 protein, partial [Candidatus Hydrogenedentota bacterium]